MHEGITVLLCSICGRCVKSIVLPFSDTEVSAV